jgi:hypothetical protein
MQGTDKTESMAKEFRLNEAPAANEPEVIDPPSFDQDKQEMYYPYPTQPVWSKGCSSWPW